jgi:magnesium-transporting ATPase (P-type)
MVLIGLAICHSVTPLENGHYIASSPDEIALVKFAEEGGVKLIKRS